MPDKRPKVNYTMSWNCVFVIDGKTEEICFLTDDIEEIYVEYQNMKMQFKSVVWLKHELHTKGRLLMNDSMWGIPADIPDAPQTGTGAVPMAIIDADAPSPRRVRNMVQNGVINADHPPAWMEKHNSDMAKHILREPPQDKI